MRAGVTPVRRELREALAEAYGTAGRASPRWTDASPAVGSTPIRALHVTELRAAVLALEWGPIPGPAPGPAATRVPVLVAAELGTRGAAAVAELRTLQGEYEAWRDNLPEALAGSRTAELLDVELPWGFGRDLKRRGSG